MNIDAMDCRVTVLLSHQINEHLGKTRSVAISRQQNSIFLVLIVFRMVQHVI
jgi:hypothetical protein